MEKNWIKLFSSTDPVEVEIAKHVLHENNIHSVTINQQDSSYLMFGTINLYVKKDNEKEANKLIQKNQNERNA
tara:strand:- start:1212 stop:1430 length:219 start_codon:yes stop_codon:yes gene_type:complete